MPSDLYFFEGSYFGQFAERHRERYASAHPFPHCVLDNFLPETVATGLADDFPRSDFAHFKLNENRYQWKKQSSLQHSNFEGLSPRLRHILNEFNGKVFLDFLENLTGIPGLVSDPHFNGGALHQILPGGRLAIHSDFSFDPRRRLDRRLNVLFYLNPDWQEGWKGDLQLWDREVSRCEARIFPLLNRCVIFNTDSESFHGHPDPLECPPNRTRNSLALYYYTNGRPEQDKAQPQDTNWKARPAERFPGQGVTNLKRAFHLLQQKGSRFFGR